MTPDIARLKGLLEKATPPGPYEHWGEVVDAFGGATEVALALVNAAPELLASAEKAEELEKLVYVPGVTRCAKCNLRLVSSTLNATTGTVSANKAPQDCPNGCGPMWRITEREAGNELCDRLDASAEREGRMREALTPSGETKAAYIGEFSIPFPDVDADGEEYLRSINVPWDTIKEIMAAIIARAALGDST